MIIDRLLTCVVRYTLGRCCTPIEVSPFARCLPCVRRDLLDAFKFAVLLYGGVTCWRAGRAEFLYILVVNRYLM